MWHCTTDDGHSEFLLHSNHGGGIDEDTGEELDPLREGLLKECCKNKSFRKVSIDRDKIGRVVKFIFETV